MEKVTKSPLYTRGGDKGETSLFGGTRVKKSDQRIVTIGAVDKLNASLGLAAVNLRNSEKKLVEEIQSTLFSFGALLANPSGLKKREGEELNLSEKTIIKMENNIDLYDSKIPPLRNFILPGGSEAAAGLHFSRTLAREAERELSLLSEKTEIDPILKKYLNRLSDFLFVLARYANQQVGKKDKIWKPSKEG